MQVLELTPSEQGKPASATTHPFFIAAQFHPELTSRPVRPQPLFMGLVAASLVRKYGEAAQRDPDVRRWLRKSAAPVAQTV